MTQNLRRRVRHTPAPSCNTSSNINRFAPEEVFVDKIRLKFPVRAEDSPLEFEEGPYSWRLGRDMVGLTDFIEDLGGCGTVWVRVADFHDGQTQRWSLEFNPSKVMFGEDYVRGATQVDLQSAINRVLADFHAKDFPALNQALATVHRLDLAVDFDVAGTSTQSIIRAFTGARRDERTKHETKSGRGDATTLIVGPGLRTRSRKSWSVRMYDRSRIADPYGSNGPLRTEVQLRRQSLKERNLDTVGDILKSDLPAILEYFWHRCRFDSRISPKGTLPEQLLNYFGDLGVTGQPRAAEIGNTLGYIEMRRLGLDDYSSHLRKKYEATLRAAGCDALDWDGSVQGYLNPATRTFVASG